MPLKLIVLPEYLYNSSKWAEYAVYRWRVLNNKVAKLVGKNEEKKQITIMINVPGSRKGRTRYTYQVAK